MNSNQKRYRQSSIIECFALSKKPRNNFTDSTMSEYTINRGPSSTATKERVPSKNDLQEFVNAVFPVENDSSEIKIENSESNEESSAFTKPTEIKVAGPLPEDSSLEDNSVPSSSHSLDLFPDSETDVSESESVPEISASPDSDDLDQLLILNRTPDCCIPLPKLEPVENHSIMFSPHIRPGDAPRPFPTSYRDKWDSDHVRMPCSPMSRFPVENAAGDKQIISRWDLVCKSLRSEIESSKELEAAIMKYNKQYVGKWNFQGLHAFMNKIWSEEERDHFFEVILPSMVEVTLNLPDICTQPVPLLKREKDHYVTMSQKQIGCLLLNAFFCTYPRRTPPSRHNKQRWNYEYILFPDINFNRLFAGDNKNYISSRNAAKLQCIFNYFRRIVFDEPTGTVTFHRQCLRDDMFPKWQNSSRGLRPAVIVSQGLIESEGQGMLQVDFANKFVGGGVIGHGCVQEEIRFLICPELIVSRLFVESLGDNEVLIITGVEQYNKYSGYGDSFQWEGDFRDKTPRDSWGRRYTQLVAMDAIHFKNSADQFKTKHILRELNKAYCGFYENAPPVHLSAVATGNWGCGIYKGNPSLKFLIQLMAASQAGRHLLYFTFGNKKLKKQLQRMNEFLDGKNLAVGDVWRLLMSYTGCISLFTEAHLSDLYEFIYSQFVTKRNPEHQNKRNIDRKQERNGDSQQEGNSSDLFPDDSDEKLFESIARCSSSTEIEVGT